MADYTTLDDAGSFFNPVLYTGTGSSLAITGVGFQPDLTWIKGRSFVGSHKLTDAVRGVTEELESNTTIAENTEANGLTAFGADGFTVGSNADYNTSSATLVAWNWKAGTTTGIAGSPSITPSSYSFNQTCGFSIIAYTGNYTAGATVPHGLGVAPKMIIVKRLDTSADWMFYNKGMDATAPEDYYMVLNTYGARVDSTIIWNDTAPTSTLFSIGTSTNVNGNTNTYIAYCFADVQGFSKFGGYQGNANADGPFVYTGFRPAYVLLKRTAVADSWNLFDSKRLGYNWDNEKLAPNNTSVGQTSNDFILLLSNGFKLTTTNTAINNSGELNIYAAFAEAPFVNSEGVPVGAR